MGTVPPSSFFLCDVMPWLGARGLDAAAFVARGVRGLGSVSVERLRMGRQGPVAPSSVQYDYVDIWVDEREARVGNPFCEADLARLSRAFDELLRTLLTVTFPVDESLRDFEGAMQDDPTTLGLLAPLERHLLRSISERHGVKVRRRLRACACPFAIRSWLVHHALLLAHGQSLRLLSWCTGGAAESTPRLGHAQLLMGALLWLVAVRLGELRSSSHLLPPGYLTSQVRTPPLWFPLSLSRFLM
jgi:hypothetical protein